MHKIVNYLTVETYSLIKSKIEKIDFNNFDCNEASRVIEDYLNWFKETLYKKYMELEKGKLSRNKKLILVKKGPPLTVNNLLEQGYDIELESTILNKIKKIFIKINYENYISNALLKPLSLDSELLNTILENPLADIEYEGNNLSLNHKNHLLLITAVAVMENFFEEKDRHLYSIDTFNSEKDICYFDFNVYNKFSKDELSSELRALILDLEERFQLVFSPVHVEESLNLDEISKKKFFDTIGNLTNNVTISDLNGRGLYKETPDKAEERIRKNFIQKIAEAQMVIERKLMNSTLNEPVVYNNHSLFYNISQSNSNFPKEIIEKIDMIKNSNNINDIKILDLVSLFDSIGYHSDSSIKTIKTSIYDIRHIQYGSFAKYFYTTDKILSERTKEIFKILNIGTEVFHIKI